MRVKTVEVDGKQYAELDSNGRVLYEDGGRELAFDAADTYSKIQELTSEAQKNREAKQTAERKAADLETKLQDFEKSGKLDAGKLEEIRAEEREKFQTALDEARQENDDLRRGYQESSLESAFNGSQFVRESLAAPPDMLRRTFGDRFQYEDNRLVAKDANGQTIYSKEKPGEPAGFEEALRLIVEAYPYRDQITKASNHRGTGGEPDERGPTRTVTRSQFEKMDPREQAEVGAGAREGKLRLVD